MYCKKCGNEISDGAKFCKFCGAVQESQAAESFQKPQNVDPVKEAEQQRQRERLDQQIVSLESERKALEEKIKEDTKATIRCIPFETFLDDDKEPGVCMVTGKPSACRALFARSY